MPTNLSQKILPVLVIFIFLFINAYSQKTTVADTSKVRHIRINPGKAVGEDVAADDIFSSVEYIPLETTAKSIFGKVDQLEIVDGNFIIFDEQVTRTGSKRQSAVLIFDHSGKFKMRIDPGEAYSMAVDREKKEIILDQGLKVVHYNFEGKKISEEDVIFSYSSVFYLPGNKRMYFRAYRQPGGWPADPEKGKKAYHNLVMLNGDRSVSRLYFPTDTLPETVTFRNGGFNYLTRSGNDLLYRTPFTFDIYGFEGDKLLKLYDFIFPMSATVPTDLSSWPDEKKYAYYDAHPRSVYNMVDVYKAGNILGFTLYKPHDNPLFFYNLKNNLLTASAAIKTDDTKLILPLRNPIVACDGTLMYTWHKAAPFFSQRRSVSNIKTDTALINQIKKYGDKALNIDLGAAYKGRSEKLAKFLKDGSAKDNPVLVILKVI